MLLLKFMYLVDNTTVIYSFDELLTAVSSFITRTFLPEFYRLQKLYVKADDYMQTEHLT